MEILMMRRTTQQDIFNCIGIHDIKSHFLFIKGVQLCVEVFHLSMK